MNIFEMFPRFYTCSPPIHPPRSLPLSSPPFFAILYLFLLFAVPLSLLQVVQRKKNIIAKSIVQDSSKAIASLQQHNGISRDLLLQLE
jgi:hypothetical protein